MNVEIIEMRIRADFFVDNILMKVSLKSSNSFQIKKIDFALTLLIHDTWWPSSEIVFCLEKLYFIETILTRDYLERVRKVARHVVFQKASPKINKQKIYSSNKSSFPFLVLPTCGYCGEIIWQTQRIAIFKSIPSWRQKISKPALT